VKYSRATFALFVVVLSPLPAAAFTGNQLRSVCIKKTGMSDVGCLYYVTGFADGLLIGKLAGEKDGQHMYCPPAAGVVPDQARLIVEKFLQDHPERLHERAAHLVAEALMNAFPCSKKPR
jgi:hypothetical protein